MTAIRVLEEMDQEKEVKVSSNGVQDSEIGVSAYQSTSPVKKTSPDDTSSRSNHSDS